MKLKNVDKFHRLKNTIPNLIRQTIDGSEIIHGSRAVNKQLQSQHIRTQTKDFDVFSKNPRKSAYATENYLDKQMGFDAFEVKKSEVHLGTYKVRARANSETYADFTKPTQKIPYKIINGKKYATLAYHQKHAQKTIKEGTATHRAGKDRDQINRIKINRRQNIQW